MTAKYFKLWQTNNIEGLTTNSYFIRKINAQ